MTDRATRRPVDDADALPAADTPAGALFGLGGLLVAAGYTLTLLARQHRRHTA